MKKKNVQNSTVTGFSFDLIKDTHYKDQVVSVNYHLCTRLQLFFFLLFFNRRKYYLYWM